MKFIKASYNSDSGISIVTMKHLGKKFVGKARLHPDDEDKASKFAGCEYAEIRATIKALKYARKLAKAKSDGALDFLKSCECYKDFDKESPTAQVLYRQLNKRIEKVNKITDEINTLMEELDALIRRRDVVVNAIKRNKETKSKMDN